MHDVFRLYIRGPPTTRQFVSARAEPPAWEYLLSHHAPDRLSRTIPVRVGLRLVHFCARCSGQVLGAVGWLGIYFAARAVPFALFSPLGQILFAVLPMPAAWDWISQTVQKRESTNPRRLLSGLLLGAALADALALLATWHLLLVLGAVVVFAAYAMVLAAILRVTGAWREVLERHFPGIDLGPAGGSA